MSDIITTKKELAARLHRNPRYVSDMILGGFRLPCREQQAIEYLQKNPHPTRNRERRKR